MLLYLLYLLFSEVMIDFVTMETFVSLQIVVEGEENLALRKEFRTQSSKGS